MKSEEVDIIHIKRNYTKELKGKACKLLISGEIAEGCLLSALLFRKEKHH